MKQGILLFLKLTILLIAIVVFIWMVIFPQTEGRAAHLDHVSIYADPLIIYMYIASIPFFVALYQAIKLLGLVEKNNIISQAALGAIRTIKYCAIALIGFILAAVSYIFIMVKLNPNVDEDPVGFVALGFVLILGATLVATAAVYIQRRLPSESGIRLGGRRR
jgi:hypothetical protein